MSTTTQDTGKEGLVDQAKSELGDVASDVQDKAVELKEQGRGKLGETLDRRTTEVGRAGAAGGPGAAPEQHAADERRRGQRPAGRPPHGHGSRTGRAVRWLSGAGER